MNTCAPHALDSCLRSCSTARMSLSSASVSPAAPSSRMRRSEVQASSSLPRSTRLLGVSGMSAAPTMTTAAGTGRGRRRARGGSATSGWSVGSVVHHVRHEHAHVEEVEAGRERTSPPSRCDLRQVHGCRLQPTHHCRNARSIYILASYGDQSVRIG